MKPVFALLLFLLLNPVTPTSESSAGTQASSHPYDFSQEARESARKARQRNDVVGLLHQSVAEIKAIRNTWKSNSIKPRGLNFRLVRGDGYETKLGLSLARSIALNETDQIGFELRYLPHELKDPWDKQRIHILDASVMFRRFLNYRLYMQMQAGVRHYKPNQSLRTYYAQNRGQPFEAENHPYASIGAGWLLLKDLPVLHRPLVVAASYTVAEKFDYPSVHPLGHVNFDPKGFHVGLKVGFKF